MYARTILVVDDVEDDRDWLVTTLRDGGYRVLEAGSVREALSLLRVDRPVDAIVADYKLGDGSGAELIHQARNQLTPGPIPLPALICTAYAYVELPPAVIMLRKPVEPEDLLAALKSVVGASAVA
ncbi:MAG: response regulator [Polyangiaceae bacterium]